MSGPPKALIDELVARWTLSGLKLLVVEGAYDQRYFHLLKDEPYCGAGLHDLDVWTIDAIHVPPEIVAKNGFKGTGCKQRTISFIRQIEARGEDGGFRGLVDRDLDEFLGVNQSSVAIVYTDNSCLDVTLWSKESLRRLLVQYRCEERVDTPEKLGVLYKSILKCCKSVTAVRIVNEQHPNLTLGLHHSESGLSVDGVEVKLNLELFIEQCKPAKGGLIEAKEKIYKCLEGLAAVEPLNSCNGHDLVWIVCYSLKQLTKEAARQVTEEIVSNSLLSHGLSNSGVMHGEAIAKLEAWASS